MAFSQRTEKLSWGVERGAGKMKATPPRRDQVEAASSQKWREKCRTSWAMTSLGAS